MLTKHLSTKEFPHQILLISPTMILLIIMKILFLEAYTMLQVKERAGMFTMAVNLIIQKIKSPLKIMSMLLLVMLRDYKELELEDS